VKLFSVIWPRFGMPFFLPQKIMGPTFNMLLLVTEGSVHTVAVLIQDEFNTNN